MTLGQLTYASFDAQGAQRGGWQVKEHRDLPAGVRVEDVVARVTTSLDSGQVVPQFPTTEERQRLPRRVLYGPVGDTYGWWHSVPAGADASGRQGNVFTHAVVGTGPFRPSQLLWSPHWLVPFGTREVAAAALVGPPEPLDVTARVQHFLDAGPGWPLGTLGVIADAVAACLAGGPVVAVLTDSTVEAADWVTALSLCCSPATARTLSFATLERAPAAGLWAAQGLHLVGVPRIDRDALLVAPDVVVIDPLGEVELAAPGDEHRTGTGGTLRAGAWSALIVDQLGDTARLAETVADLDRIATQVGDHGLAPAWPMAMRAAAQDRTGTELATVRVLAAATPDRIVDHPDLYQSVSRALQAGMAEGGEAAVADSLDHASPLMAELTTLLLAEALMRDVPRLCQPGEVAVPQASTPPQVTRDALAALADGIRGLGDVPPLDGARGALRLIDVLAGLGWLDRREVAGPVEALLDRALPELRSSTAEALTSSVEGLSEATLATVRTGLRDAVLPGQAPLGTRVPVATLTFLGLLDPARLTEMDWLYGGAPHPSAIAAEIAIHGLADGRHDASSATVARFLATEALLREGAAQDPHGHLSRLLEAQAFGPYELAALVRQFGTAVPETRVVAALLGSEASDSLDGLCQAVASSAGYGPHTRDLADLRWSGGRLSRTYAAPGDVQQVLGMADHYRTALDPAFLGQLSLGAVIGMFHSYAPPGQLLDGTPPAVTADEVGHAATGALRAIRPDARLMQLAILHPAAPTCRLDARQQAWLRAFVVRGSQDLVLDAVAVAALADVRDEELTAAAETAAMQLKDRFCVRWVAKQRPKGLMDRFTGLFKGGEQ